jgi:hypothetical protein
MDSLPAMPFAYPVVGGGATRTQLSPFIIF